jgi:hypothetical protein
MNRSAFSLSVPTRLLRLFLAALAGTLLGALLGTGIDAIRGLPGWHITGASIGIHAGLLLEAWRLGLLGEATAEARAEETTTLKK